MHSKLDPGRPRQSLRFIMKHQDKIRRISDAKRHRENDLYLKVTG